MNMGKKLLLFLISFLMFAGSVYAYSIPRWFNMPVSVYLPKQEESDTVTGAFKAWQSASKGTVRFLYRNSKNLAAISNINVGFVDSLPENKAYKINPRFSMSWDTNLYSNSRYYSRMGILIALKDSDGNPIPENKLYAIALRAVGEALGLDPVKSENSVMFYSDEFKNTNITKDDIAEIMRVYKPVYKK